MYRNSRPPKNGVYDAGEDPVTNSNDSEKQIVDMAVDLLVEEQDEIDDLKKFEHDIQESTREEIDQQLDPVDFTVDMSVASVAAVSFTVLVTIAAFTALILFIIDRLRKASLQKNRLHSTKTVILIFLLIKEAIYMLGVLSFSGHFLLARFK